MVIFTAVVTLSTVVYAILTAMLAVETKKMRQVQTEPKIEVVLRPREEIINIVNIYIKNIGLGPAYDLKFDIKAEQGGEGAKRLIEDFTRCNFFRTGLKYIGPGQEIASDYSQLTEMFDQKIESVLNVTILYKSVTKKCYQEKFRIDFSEFKGRSQLGKPHLYSIAQSFEKLQKDIGHLVSGFKHIQADIHTFEDRERVRKEREEQLEQMRAKQQKEKKKSS